MVEETEAIDLSVLCLIIDMNLTDLLSASFFITVLTRLTVLLKAMFAITLFTLFVEQLYSCVFINLQPFLLVQEYMVFDFTILLMFN